MLAVTSAACKCSLWVGVLKKKQPAAARLNIVKVMHYSFLKAASVINYLLT